MYWRSYDKADGLDDRLAMVTRLTDLYLQRNQLDGLLARLQRERAESPQKRKREGVDHCLAHLLPAPSSRATWARPDPSWSGCSRPTPRHPAPPASSSKLAEDEGDFEGAARHQKRGSWTWPPNDEGQLRLAQLHDPPRRYGRGAGHLDPHGPRLREDAHHMLQERSTGSSAARGPPPSWKSPRG